LDRRKGKRENEGEVISHLNEKIEKIKQMGKENTLSDADFDTLRRDNWESTQETMAVFDKAMKRRWTSGTTKFYYEVFKDFLETQGAITNNLLYLMQWYIDLRDAIVELSTEMQSKGMALTEKMNKILENPAVQIITEILENDKKRIEEINKRREKLIKQTVV
jgi:hypothetical protein